MHIGQVLDGVYDADVGWRAASGGIKPVHVANGLVRSLTGHYFDPRILHEFVVWWRRGKVRDDARTYEALVESSSNRVFDAFAGQQQKFERVRRYALGLLNADRALFPSCENSSFSLTSARMATRDNNDRGLGEFGAAIVSSGDALLCASLTDALDDRAPRDPVTALVWPLLPESGKEVTQKALVAEALGRRHNREFGASMSDAAETLAGHEARQGNRMRTLARTVQFVCVATHAHAQFLGGNGKADNRVPALLAMTGHGTEVARASERSLESIYSSFEQWLGTRLARRMNLGKPLTTQADDGVVECGSLDGRVVRSVLRHIGVASRKHGPPDDAVLRGRMMHFTTVREAHTSGDPCEVLAHALVRSYCQEFGASGGPRKFLQGLGCRVGLLYPHFQGRARRKRFRPSTAILDMLVRACVGVDESIPLDEFLERLWRRFGIMVGGRRNVDWDDSDYLGRSGIAIDGEALDENTRAFLDQLCAMGLARRYADDVAFVGVLNAK